MSEDIRTENNAKTLPLKVFSKRESLLTDLCEVKHFKIIKHAFVALLFGFLVKDLIRYFTNAKNVNFGLRLIKLGWANWHLALLLWIVLFTINLLTYVLFIYWANQRIKTKPKSLYRKLWDTLFITIIILYYTVCLFIPPHIVANYIDFGKTSSFTILIENIRLLMKAHSFIRSNVPNILSYKPHSDHKLDLPTISNYLYFSFAPTLLYRKEYPRTEKVNTKLVLTHFTEILVLIWLQSYIYEIFFLKPFQNIGKSEVDWRHITVVMVENFIAGGFMLASTFYIVLHAWSNTFAELLRFADRRFYEDWWTSTNYATYFRSWNIVVHDWLYEYVYRDFYIYIVPNNKTVAKVMVFLLSAVIHEHMIFYALNQFVPVLFMFFFCFGVTFTSFKTKHPLFNIFLLYSLALGNNVQMSLHIIEYFARTNCPYSHNGNSSILLPRFITLDCV